MNTAQILSEIREANHSFLALAQRLIRVDPGSAALRLGISEPTARLISRLSPAQLHSIASGNSMLCSFRLEDDTVWNLMASHGRGASNEVTQLPSP